MIRTYPIQSVLPHWLTRCLSKAERQIKDTSAFIPSGVQKKLLPNNATTQARYYEQSVHLNNIYFIIKYPHQLKRFKTITLDRTDYSNPDDVIMLIDCLKQNAPCIEKLRLTWIEKIDTNFYRVYLKPINLTKQIYHIERESDYYMEAIQP